jgi:hypothetical protein
MARRTDGGLAIAETRRLPAPTSASPDCWGSIGGSALLDPPRSCGQRFADVVLMAFGRYMEETCRSFDEPVNGRVTP